MESVGTILGDGREWISSSSSSFNGMFSSTEEADFMAQLLGNCSFPNEISSISNLCWPSPVYSSSSSSDHNIMFSFSSHDSQGSSSHHNGGASFFPTISSDSPHHHLQQYYYDYPILTRNDSSVSSLTCYMMAEDHVNKNSSTNSMELLMEAETGDEYLNPDLSNDDSVEESARDLLLMPNPHEDEEKFPIPETSLEDQEDSLSGTSKKRPRMPMDNQVKNKRIVKPKKNQKLTNINNGGENDNKYPAVLQRQQSNINCLSEEDDSKVSQEHKTSSISATNVNGKTRASRGSATDPQSLYARKRRERINERLRILQNLVPNGTKVDISTMLEEAVQYVKFLQLQIKLLSSDDLWMYAPIAYNGMNVGLDLKIATTPKSS